MQPPQRQSLSQLGGELKSKNDHSASCFGEMDRAFSAGLAQSFVVGYPGKGVTSAIPVAEAKLEGADYRTPGFCL